MASFQRRLIATLAIAAILAIGLPSAGFGGGSDEPGYTGGTRGTGSTSPGDGGTGTGTTTSTDHTPDPEPLATTEGTAAALVPGTQGFVSWLIASWLTLSSTLTLR